ncbi:hypothetical protein C5F59_015110 [Streptomyces sp. QL37]|uniref:hypothetical protein n=1 Tax=Streptomyces sp. QL37 TaxID=2093747 RepID=UPI000CF1CFE3|nr:hypothetical protein [Streptomyces sp. QL37]PPQ59309.1 hypothetical protein C5F59_23555 [Streptomyces sp. QL37]
MADEQYEWLDAEAAEMLLRGESVEPVDDHARTEARRVEAALRALRAPGPSGDELPGEAAVLAAFREASRGGKRAGAASPTGIAGQPDAQHTVRIGATRTAPPRRPRWARPLRYGLAVSLAGCALGGVAVAGGTGMLPAPFGGKDSPVPAASVSASASSEELGAEVPDAGEPPSPLPSVTPDAPSSPSPTDVPDGGVPGDDPGTGQDDGGAADREDTGRDSGTGDAEDGTAAPQAPGTSPAEVLKKSAKACRAYRENTLSREERSRLLELADGERNLGRFCDRLLGPDDRDGGSGEDGRDDDGNNGKGDGKDGGGSLPAITFRAPSEGAAQDDAPQDGGERATAGPAASAPSAPLSATR